MTRLVPDRTSRTEKVRILLMEDQTLPIWGLMTNELPGLGQLSVVSMEQAIKELIASKTAANRRPVYVKSLRIYLNNFARGREQMPIASVTRHHVFDWLSASRTAPSSYKTRLHMLAVLFSYSMRVGYVAVNPCTQIERPRIDRKPPRVLRPAEVRRMLRWARRRMNWRLPQLILGVYAGVRPAELCRLHWSDVDMERGFVRIDAAASKTRRRRIVHLDPKAMAWLKACRRTRTSRPLGTYSDKWKKSILRNCGIEWSADVLRHTAASYLLAKHGDVGKVSRMLGNSQDVLLNHYIDLVDPADCRRFWKI